MTNDSTHPAQALAAEVHTLFSLPDVVLRACAVIDAPDSTAQDLVEVIELDANLATTVLRLANSALYGQRGRVETLSRAVTIIGHRALRDLVLATAAVKTFQGIPAEFVDMDIFWDNSTTCGVVARLLADYLRMREGETLFLAGLLHGVGRLVFYARRPDDYRQALELARNDNLPLHQAEAQIFGFDHAELGATLLRNWNLPERLCVAVRYQHNPDGAHPVFQKEVDTIHLATQMATHLAPCLKIDQEPPPYAPDDSARAAMARLGLKPAQIEEIRLESLAASLEIIEILHPGASVIF